MEKTSLNKLVIIDSTSNVNTAKSCEQKTLSTKPIHYGLPWQAKLPITSTMASLSNAIQDSSNIESSVTVTSKNGRTYVQKQEVYDFSSNHSLGLAMNVRHYTKLPQHNVFEANIQKKILRENVLSSEPMMIDRPGNILAPADPTDPNTDATIDALGQPISRDHSPSSDSNAPSNPLFSPAASTIVSNDQHGSPKWNWQDNGSDSADDEEAVKDEPDSNVGLSEVARGKRRALSPEPSEATSSDREELDLDEMFLDSEIQRVAELSPVTNAPEVAFLDMANIKEVAVPVPDSEEDVELFSDAESAISEERAVPPPSTSRKYHLQPSLPSEEERAATPPAKRRRINSPINISSNDEKPTSIASGIHKLSNQNYNVQQKSKRRLKPQEKRADYRTLQHWVTSIENLYQNRKLNPPKDLDEKMQGYLRKVQQMQWVILKSEVEATDLYAIIKRVRRALTFNEETREKALLIMDIISQRFRDRSIINWDGDEMISLAL